VHDTQFKVLKYLRKHRKAGLDEISTALDLKLMDVLEVLLELEKKGEVESFLVQ
jgi:predicted ArsR family transcriptional regulator